MKEIMHTYGALIISAAILVGILALFSNTIYSESGKVNNLLMFLPKDYVSMQN